MPAEPLTADQVLRQLAEIGGEVSAALQAGELTAADEALARWEAGAQALGALLKTAPLSAGQLGQMDALLRQGDRFAQSLLARRETARALISELEAERLQLTNLTPQRSMPGLQLDVTG